MRNMLLAPSLVLSLALASPQLYASFTDSDATSDDEFGEEVLDQYTLQSAPPVFAVGDFENGLTLTSVAGDLSFQYKCPATVETTVNETGRKFTSETPAHFAVTSGETNLGLIEGILRPLDERIYGASVASESTPLFYVTNFGILKEDDYERVIQGFMEALGQVHPCPSRLKFGSGIVYKLPLKSATDRLKFYPEFPSHGFGACEGYANQITQR